MAFAVSTVTTISGAAAIRFRTEACPHPFPCRSLRIQPLLPMASKPLHLLFLGLLGAAPLAVVPLVLAQSAAPPVPTAAAEPAAAAAPAVPPMAPPEASLRPQASPLPPSSSPQPPLAESPLRPSADERRSLPPRRFDASLDELVRDGVISPSERVRVHGGLIGPMNAARRQACSNGALSALECGTGVVLRGRGRLDGAGFAAGDGEAGLNAAGVGRFGTDALPLPPISVPVSALLSGAGGTFRLTDVFGRTPRPAAIAGNGNAGLLFPLIGSAVMSSPFGWRLHPVMGTWLMHAGRDLAAPEGTPVVAALNGRVMSSGLAGGYGLAVEIEHDGPRRRTLYGHLSELYVKEGQVVRQGEVIGRVGSTGLSTGPHLHFELRMPQEGGWVAVDPGELDPSGSLIASQLGQPGGLPTDAVALLMGELIQTLERPRSPLGMPATPPSPGVPVGTAAPAQAPWVRQRG
jgi:murein DD-endopeptidase MepM/ murein hydrolase activator NlpD